jgi:hypothetical protein
MRTAEVMTENVVEDNGSRKVAEEPQRTVPRTYLASYETPAASESHGDQGRPENLRRSPGGSLRPALEWWAANRCRSAYNDSLTAPVPRRITSSSIE